jgi:hypothetical protein
MKARTPYLKLLSASTMALLVVMVAGFLVSERASAQRLPPPAPADPVLAAVQDVQRSLAGLQVNLDALQQGLDLQLAPLGVNFRWTPVAFASDGLAFCHVVNISDVQRTIRIELKNGQGANLIDVTIDKAPGTTTSMGMGQRKTGDFHCKFTVLNGTRDDIRGTIIVGNANGQLTHIPAE